MKEELLHYLWQTKSFDLADLETTEGETVSLIKFGTHNVNAGPDFLNGQVKIGDTLWNGHIEIHTQASHWRNHRHHNDIAYNNVILHVVYENDSPILNANNQAIPTIELKNRFPFSYIDDHLKLISSLSWIPCADHLSQIDQSKVPFFLERLLVNRLEEKCKRISELCKSTKNDWEEVLYKLLLRYLGLKINSDGFQRLSEVLPYSILKKQAESIQQKESLLFGQADLLSGNDSYFQELKKEYKHQQNKYKLTPMRGVEWLFAKLRPANFPTIRIAQIAALYHKTPSLFSEIIAAKSLTELEELFEISASTYWDTHYIPEKTSTKRKKKIGKTTKQILIINVVAPLIFAYATAKDDEPLKEKALDILYKLPSENNNIIRRFSQMALKAESAAQSQALIELKTNYCDKQQCLSCQIGQQIIFQ